MLLRMSEPEPVRVRPGADEPPPLFEAKPHTERSVFTAASLLREREAHERRVVAGPCGVDARAAGLLEVPCKITIWVEHADRRHAGVG